MQHFCLKALELPGALQGHIGNHSERIKRQVNHFCLIQEGNDERTMLGSGDNKPILRWRVWQWQWVCLGRECTDSLRAEVLIGLLSPGVCALCLQAGKVRGGNRSNEVWRKGTVLGSWALGDATAKVLMQMLQAPELHKLHLSRDSSLEPFHQSIQQLTCFPQAQPRSHPQNLVVWPKQVSRNRFNNTIEQ